MKMNLKKREDFVMWELPGQRKTLYDPCFYQNSIWKYHLQQSLQVLDEIPDKYINTGESKEPEKVCS